MDLVRNVMKNAAVIGHPVTHSLSPLIHSYWLRRYGIDGGYRAIDIAPGALAVARDDLCRDLVGFNVTLPHKEAMVPLCDDLDDAARAIGAVNTVVCDHGRLLGRNTDAFGFRANLDMLAPGWRDSPRGTAAILGAGGAARAVVFALLDAGIDRIVLCNRNRNRADRLAAEPFCHDRVSVLPWDRRGDLPDGASLIVNTTSLGMAGQPPLDISLDRAMPEAVACDIVYRPLETPFLQAARDRGMLTVTGIGMLLHQARPAFHAWFGIMPDVDETLVRMAGDAAQ